MVWRLARAKAKRVQAALQILREPNTHHTSRHVYIPAHPSGAEARAFTLCLDAERRAKLDEIAQERHITPSQLVRDLIDAL